MGHNTPTIPARSSTVRTWSQGLDHSAIRTASEATTWVMYQAVLAQAVSCPLRTSPSPWTRRALKESPPSMQRGGHRGGPADLV